MNEITVAIVDDEAPARAIVREYLSARPQFEVVPECANGFEAVKAVSERRRNDRRPDLDCHVPLVANEQHALTATMPLGPD